jgi:hypothetical protein
MRSIIAGMLVLGVLVCVNCGVVFADEVSHSFPIYTPPDIPTTSDPITLYTQWGRAAWDQVLSTSYSLSENHIEIDILIQDLRDPNAGEFWPLGLWLEESSVNLGTLPEGHYEVTSFLSIIPWGRRHSHTIPIGKFLFQCGSRAVHGGPGGKRNYCSHTLC